MPNQIMQYIQLQLFITLFSWPILLAWGLPLSLASPIGNFIFTPFVTIFLFLSSLIFFCELLYIPNGMFIGLLEKTSDIWLSIVSYAKQSWLLSLAQPPLIIAFIIPLVACAIVNHRIINTITKRTIALGLATILIYCYLSFINQPRELFEEINCFDKTITLIHSNKQTVLIDTGAIGRRVSSTNWVNYNLTSILIKKGISSLDHLIILKPSSTVFNSITILCKNFDVKKIYCVTWSGSLNNTGWFAWQQLLETVKHKNIELIIIDQEKITIALSGHNRISIEPNNKQIKKSGLKYNMVNIFCKVLDQESIINNSTDSFAN